MKTSQYVVRKRKGIVFWQIPVFENWGSRALFYFRTGGVSPSPFRGLNLGLNTEDAYEHVVKNRRLAYIAGKLGPLLPVVGNQVHGNRIQSVSRKDAGRGWYSIHTAIPQTDGLITSVPGLPLAITVADCLPVLFTDEEGTAVAAVHAGWRGIAQGILLKIVKQFRIKKNIKSDRLWVAIGPAIGPSAFTIYGDTLEQLQTILPEAVKRHTSGAMGYDLWLAARHQLIQSGINKEKIITIRDCTASHPRKYFSYRRDKITGRMLGIVQICIS